MKRPKSVKPKRWKLILQVQEMNKRIVNDRKKNSMYVSDWLDDVLLNAGEYKANRKKNKK
ncbi:MAG: hypothetical protein J6Y37_14105 [Paludibacteraceae bacterium]|nr:hypothetical protein [Paludibacteraceae bacterium]